MRKRYEKEKLWKLPVVTMTIMVLLQAMFVALGVINTATRKCHNGKAEVPSLNIFSKCEKHDLGDQVAWKIQPVHTNVCCLEAGSYLWHGTNLVNSANDHHVVSDFVTRWTAIILTNARVVKPIGLLLVLSTFLARLCVLRSLVRLDLHLCWWWSRLPLLTALHTWIWHLPCVW